MQDKWKKRIIAIERPGIEMVQTISNKDQKYLIVMKLEIME